MSSIGAGPGDPLARIQELTQQSEELKKAFTAFTRYKALKADPKELNQKYEHLQRLLSSASKEESALRDMCHVMASQLEDAYKKFTADIEKDPTLSTVASVAMGLPTEETKAKVEGSIVAKAPSGDISSLRKKGEIKKFQDAFLKVNEQMQLLSERMKKNQGIGKIDLNDEFDYFRMEASIKQLNMELRSADPNLSRSLRGELAILQAKINDRIEFLIDLITKEVDELHRHRNNASLDTKLAPKYQQLLKCVEKIKGECDRRESPLFHKRNQFLLAYSKLTKKDDPEFVAAMARWKKKSGRFESSAPLLLVKPGEMRHESAGHLLSLKESVPNLLKRIDDKGSVLDLELGKVCFKFEDEMASFENNQDHLIAQTKLANHPDKVMDLLEEGPKLREDLQRVKHEFVEKFCDEVSGLVRLEDHLAAPKYKQMEEFVQRLEKEYSGRENSTNGAECREMRNALELLKGTEEYRSQIDRWNALNIILENRL